MSLRISFKDFRVMVDKECITRTSGLGLDDFPTVWVEDFWPVDMDELLCIHEAHKASEACLDSIMENFAP